jgi:hypothetical protein
MYSESMFEKAAFITPRKATSDQMIACTRNNTRSHERLTNASPRISNSKYHTITHQHKVACILSREFALNGEADEIGGDVSSPFVTSEDRWKSSLVHRHLGIE